MGDDMPPLVSDAEGPCPEREPRLVGGWHIWEPEAGPTLEVPFIWVCRNCHGRKP